MIAAFAKSKMRRIPPHFLGLLACLASAAFLPGQASSPPEQIDAAKAILKRVEANSQADIEAKSLLLTSAYRLVDTATASSREKRALLEVIGAKLTKLDPHAVDRLKARTKTAKKMLRTASAYQQAGWNRTAQRVLDAALDLDPQVQPDVVASLRAILPSPNRSLLETFDGALFPYGGARWDINNEWLASPPYDTEGSPQSCLIQSQPVLDGDYEFTIEVFMGDRPGTLGITLGMTGRAERFHMVQLEFNTAQTTLSLHAYKNGRFIEKADAKVQLGAEQRATWVAIHIKVENGVLSANLPGEKPLTYEAAWPLNGSIGLFISGYTQNPNPVRFRHLQFGS